MGELGVHMPEFLEHVVVLETERLCLRHLVPGDFEFVLAMFGDPLVMRFAGDELRDEAFTRDWLEARIAAYAEHGFGFYGVVSKDTGEYCGHVGLLAQEVEGRPETEIGYWLRSQDWGKGYAVEAAAACRDYGFDVLGKERLVSLINPDNHPSRRVAERIGMRLERMAAWRGHDTCVYAIEATGSTRGGAPRPTLTRDT